MKSVFYGLVLCAAGYLAYNQSPTVQGLVDRLSNGKIAHVVRHAEDVSGDAVKNAQEQLQGWKSSQAKIKALQAQVAELKTELQQANAQLKDQSDQIAHLSEPQATPNFEPDQSTTPAASMGSNPHVVHQVTSLTKVEPKVDQAQLLALIEKMEMKAAGY